MTIKLLALSFSLLLSITLSAQATYEELSNEVTIRSEDGITLYGDLAMNLNSDKMILLFHQGGSNARGEYAYTLPHLYEMGYSILAVDLRSGGGRLGSTNRTVDNLSTEFSYCDAEQDIRAALQYADSIVADKELILIGSSYSAALVIRVAVQSTKNIRGVVSFSPATGGPMEDCSPREAIQSIEIPLLVVRPKREMEYEHVAAQMDLAKESGCDTHIAADGVHGSSLLVPEWVGGDVSASWQVLSDFLTRL